MFLFIENYKLNESLTDKFKYISCSYLSWDGNVPFNSGKDLNTSHVLIYPNAFHIREEQSEI